VSIAMNAKTQPPTPAHFGWQLASTILKWLARGIAMVLGLLWGAFFIEHVNEWYIKPPQGFPPLWVLAAMGFHLGMIVGLVAMVRWSRTGSVISCVATCGFLGMTAAHARVPLIVLINGVPVLLMIVAAILSRRARAFHG